jgi:2-methylcitrate dehydratase PrpD
MDIIVTLAKNVIETKYDTLPREAVETTKQRILDTLGVLVAGAQDCKREIGLVKEWGGKEESSILVYGGKVPAPNAGWVNSIMAQAVDFDDAVAAAHLSAATVPTALAVSEARKGVSGKELIAAITAGGDLAIRILLATKDHGFLPTGTIVVFGTAAIAAKILGLGIDGMLNALGIAFTRASSTHQVASDKVLALRLVEGYTSRSGIEAALLAETGLTGVRNILQGTYGFFHLYSRDEVDLNALTDQLGKRFEGSRASIKKYPSCGTTHTSTAATLKLVHEVDINPREIKQVTVGVSPFVHSLTGHPFKIGENPRVEAQFSLPYTVANAIVRKSSLLHHFTEPYIRDPQVSEVAEKVHPVISLEGKDLSANIEIEMRDGRKYLKSVSHSDTLLERQSMTADEVIEKFRNCLSFAPKFAVVENCERIIDMVDQLEKVDDVSELVKLLT